MYVCMYTRSPSQDFRLFGPRPWKILATSNETKRFLSNPDPGEKLVRGNLVMETGCICMCITYIYIYIYICIHISDNRNSAFPHEAPTISACTAISLRRWCVACCVFSTLAVVYLVSFYIYHIRACYSLQYKLIKLIKSDFWGWGLSMWPLL